MTGTKTDYNMGVKVRKKFKKKKKNGNITTGLTRDVAETSGIVESEANIPKGVHQI